MELFRDGLKNWTYVCYKRIHFEIKFDWSIHLSNDYSYTVFDAVQPPPLCLVPPVGLGKSWSLTISLKKNYIQNFRIRNYFKKDFLNLSFHNVRYCNHLVTFLEKISHQFAFFQALNEVSQSNIFLVFFFHLII